MKDDALQNAGLSFLTESGHKADAADSPAPAPEDNALQQGGKPVVRKPHPIAAAIDRFIHRVRDTKLAARQHLPVALKAVADQYKSIGDEFERLMPLLKSEDRRIAVLAQKEISNAMLRYRRMRNSDVPGAIEVGLFLAIFAAFDAFTGDLLRAVFGLKPDLFRSLQRTIDFADVLTAESLSALRLQVLDEEIENLRRKSYVDQFASLATRFGVKLTNFKRWPDFVECSQRRNLLTHADGVVNEQYRTVCTSQGLKPEKIAGIGTQLQLGPKYFFDSCELVIEVGLKLGQTLWRKTLPAELDAADSHLMSVLFSALEGRSWRRARMLGEFGMSQTHLANDWNRKAILINYVQALKRDGAVDQANQTLSTVDWSAAGHEFRLADLVLREHYVAAASLMRRIGPRDELLTEHAFHTWPLFLEFRETEAFAAAYADVFGHTYATKLEEVATEASAGAAEQAKRQEEAGAAVDAELRAEQTAPLVAAEPASEATDDPYSAEA